MSHIEITKSAEEYLLELLQKQDPDTIGVKVFVSEPGTPRAETCIAYCKKEDDLNNFKSRVLGFFSIKYLHNIHCYNMFL